MKNNRKVMLGIALALFISSCTSTIAPPATNCPAGDRVEEILSGGQTRQYWIHVPASDRSGRPFPLVLAFHGMGGNAEMFGAYSGFSALADERGFVAVYPQGLGEIASWDTWQGSQDVQFIRDLLDHLEMECNIDPLRIFASGHSRGGGMANRLGCDLADRIAAIGPVSGAYQFAEDCAPSRPVPVVAFHGMADTDVPYNGIGDPTTPRLAYYSIATPIPQWASSWANRNGCSLKPFTFELAGGLSAQEWGSCREKATVILYSIDGGGHGWPSSLEFNATEMIWDFFARHPLTPDQSP